MLLLSQYSHKNVTRVSGAHISVALFPKSGGNQTDYTDRDLEDETSAKLCRVQPKRSVLTEENQTQQPLKTIQ